MNRHDILLMACMKQTMLTLLLSLLYVQTLHMNIVKIQLTVIIESHFTCFLELYFHITM